MEELICRVINSGKCLGFEYDDHHRVLLPFILYRSQEGDTLVEGAQVGGKSDSGSMPYWRSFNIEELSSIEETEGPTSVQGSDKILPDTEEKYNPENERYADTVCAKDPVK